MWFLLFELSIELGSLTRAAFNTCVVLLIKLSIEVVWMFFVCLLGSLTRAAFNTCVVFAN